MAVPGSPASILCPDGRSPVRSLDVANQSHPCSSSVGVRSAAPHRLAVSDDLAHRSKPSGSGLRFTPSGDFTARSVFDAPRWRSK
jgi:hypothetical protein